MKLEKQFIILIILYFKEYNRRKINLYNYNYLINSLW